MSAHASQAFSIAHCTDSEDLPFFTYLYCFGHYRKSIFTHIATVCTFDLKMIIKVEPLYLFDFVVSVSLKLCT